jgi:arginine N-succinyltransferase
MMFIRPVAETDLEPLLKLAIEAGVGLTTLPPQRSVLKKKIDHSLESFQRSLTTPGDESYLFVLEDSKTGKIAGTTGIVSSVGLSQPFYTFRLSTSVLYSAKHQVYSRYKMLNLVNDFTGATEICTLFLSPEYRKKDNGKLLSRCRFLFAAEFPERIADVIMAEMRGLQDNQGRSPFWQSLGMRFFKMDFSKADYLSAMEHDFISDLMPKQPFYEEMLPAEARAVIGQVHKNTIPALKMLEKEGFSQTGYVDIFDGGPTIHCHTNNVYSVRNSFARKAVTGGIGTNAVDCIICNSSLGSYRSLIAKADFSVTGQIILTDDVYEKLQVQSDGRVRYIPLSYQVRQS